MKKLISLLLAAIMVLGCFGFVFADDTAADGLLIAPAPTAAASEITILYTTDAHTYIDNEEGDGLTYADVAALKASLAAAGKNVLLVDAGDHIQGTAFGGMDNGATIIKLMNAAKYDVATLGNHEFDYGMEGTLAAVEAAEYPYVSCNFYHEEKGVAGDPVLEPYKVFDFNGTKVAFVGITTPESFTKSTPKYFQDAEGNYIYGIAGGEDGAALYAAVQKAVDAASAEADYVIALAHIGSDASSSPWTSKEVIANVSGLDAWIDGHSHTTFANEIIKDKDGKDVVLTQPTEYLGAVGKMVIAADGTITSELLTATEVEADAAVKAIADEWTTSVNDLLGVVIAESDINFAISGSNAKRLIRTYETNLGDLNADAYYYTINNAGIDCDVAIMNGGGIRANVGKGEWSYLTCKTVNTFGNVLCAMKVPGQMIVDALEFGARFQNQGENGGFLHVAGLTYDINNDIENTVKVDEKNVWQEGPVEYRVNNVKVFNKTTGEYEALDPQKMYTIGGTNYTLRNQGDGFNMFQEADGMELILDGICEDYMAMATYLKAFKDTDGDGIANIASANSPLAANTGYIMNYETTAGAGRINGAAMPFTDVNDTDWFKTQAEYGKEEGFFKGYTDGSFGGLNKMTMAELTALLYNIAGADEEKVEGAWYATQQAWAEKNELVEGFVPTANVTREDFITMFVKTLALMGTDTTATEEMKTAFAAATDAAEVAEENADAIAWAIKAGLISGTSTDALTITPAFEINRATAAAMVYNYFTKVEAPLAGGWTKAADGTVTDELKGYFEKATKALMGAKYTPVELLATQVVAGTNYKVLCEKTTVTAEPVTTTVTVVLYVDLEGNCTITSIE